MFEANIRLVGGLLSSYALTGDPIFKEKAKHVADILMPAFKTNFGIPTSLINFSNGHRNTHHWTKNSILSEYGTMHLEFSYLSDITGDPDYRDRVEKVRSVLKNTTKPDGLYPNFFNISSGQFGKRELVINII